MRIPGSKSSELWSHVHLFILNPKVFSEQQKQRNGPVPIPLEHLLVASCWVNHHVYFIFLLCSAWNQKSCLIYLLKSNMIFFWTCFLYPSSTHSFRSSEAPPIQVKYRLVLNIYQCCQYCSTDYVSYQHFHKCREEPVDSCTDGHIEKPMVYILSILLTIILIYALIADWFDFFTHSATGPADNDPMKALDAPSSDRTVHEFEAFPPLCQRWDKHLHKHVEHKDIAVPSMLL